MINFESFRSPKPPELNIRIPNFIKELGKNIEHLQENFSLINQLLDQLKLLGALNQDFIRIIVEFSKSAGAELQGFDFNQILLKPYGLIEEAKADIQASIEKFLNSHPTLQSLFDKIKNVVKQQRGEISVGLALLLFFIGLFIIAALVVGTGNIAIGQVLKLDTLKQVFGGQK
ncbi:hypothetical protein HRbin35_00103 [bacterium HR35]|nr:hypothetical protein HRbin35_00103 [bacterium HR35]